MEINEFNSIATDNIATNSLSTDNTATSDELKTNYDYVAKGKTEYAKNHTVKTVTAAAILTVSFLSGGTLLTNSFLGELPTIAQEPLFSYENQDFTYSFHMENSGTMKAELVLVNSLDTIYQRDVSETGDYEDTISLDFDVFYYFRIKITNHFDFSRTIVDKEIRLLDTVTKEQS